jgi:Tfp pilus assembly protein PilO
MSEMKGNLDLVENWQEKLNTLKAQNKAFEYKIESLALDLPRKGNPAVLVGELNRLLTLNNIRNAEIVYLESSKKGKYITLPIRLKFTAHYNQAIKFLNNVENSKQLMIIEHLDFTNETNSRYKPIKVEGTISLILLDV